MTEIFFIALIESRGELAELQKSFFNKVSFKYALINTVCSPVSYVHFL